MTRSGVVGFCLALFIQVAPSWSPAAAPGGKKIVYFDPDSNYEAMPDIVAWINKHLATKLPGFRFLAVHDMKAFTKAVSESSAEYVVVPSAMLGPKAPFKLTPLLVSKGGGDVFYHKILLDRGTGPPTNLEGKRIATTASVRLDARSDDILAVLRGAGMTTTRAVVVRVSKDIDALLALSFNQVDAALVTPASLDVIREINPAAAQTMRTVWTSGALLRPPLCAVGEFENAETRAQAVAAFAGMGETEFGRNALQTMGIEGWVPFQKSMLKEDI